MRVQVLSDLHLEFGGVELPTVAADLVILAGDISVGVHGVRWARQTFSDRPVVYVPGNHEYYRKAIPKLTEKLRAEAAGSTVHVLEQDAIEIGGFTVLGCTLWTDLSLYDDPFVGGAAVADVMSDFRLIRLSPQYRRLRPQDTATFHHRSLRWLRAQMDERRGPRIVVTHHAPSAASLDPRHEGDPTNVAYASNLEELIREHQPTLWVHGHVHHKSDYQVGCTRVVCNPRGYPDDPCHDFDPAMVVEVVPGRR